MLLLKLLCIHVYLQVSFKIMKFRPEEVCAWREKSDKFQPYSSGGETNTMLKLLYDDDFNQTKMKFLIQILRLKLFQII